MNDKLFLIGSDEKGNIYQTELTDGEIALGQDEACNVRVSDRFVSTRHAVITVRDNSVSIEDEGSLNGTFVNEQKVYSRVPLAKGAKVRVGKTLFRVLEEDEVADCVADLEASAVRNATQTVRGNSVFMELLMLLRSKYVVILAVLVLLVGGGWIALDLAGRNKGSNGKTEEPDSAHSELEPKSVEQDWRLYSSSVKVSPTSVPDAGNSRALAEQAAFYWELRVSELGAPYRCIIQAKRALAAGYGAQGSGVGSESAVPTQENARDLESLIRGAQVYIDNKLQRIQFSLIRAVKLGEVKKAERYADMIQSLVLDHRFLVQEGLAHQAGDFRKSSYVPDAYKKASQIITFIQKGVTADGEQSDVVSWVGAQGEVSR